MIIIRQWARLQEVTTLLAIKAYILYSLALIMLVQFFVHTAITRKSLFVVPTKKLVQLWLAGLQKIIKIYETQFVSVALQNVQLSVKTMTFWKVTPPHQPSLFLQVKTTFDHTAELETAIQ